MHHTSDTIKIAHIALTVLRRQHQIVMVQQQSPTDLQPYWVLPGGLVEGGELITDALIREVKEETGVQVDTIGSLVAISQIDRPAEAAQALAFLFEVVDWHGTFRCQDPDGEVQCVEVVDEAEAIRRLQSYMGWAGIQEPLLAHLRGEVQPGMMWFYREEGNGQLLLDSVLLGHSQQLCTAA